MTVSTINWQIPEADPVCSTQVHRYQSEQHQLAGDQVIVEAPLEILVKAQDGEIAPLVTTMRTPGNDLNLALGYMRSENLLPENGDLQAIPAITAVERPLLISGEPNLNQIIFSMPKPPETANQRRGVQSSSCGACGKLSIDDMLEQIYPARNSPTYKWTCAKIDQARELITHHQALFDLTGGSHGVWLISPENEVISHYEDVGRHNCLDKLLGDHFLNKLSGIENALLLLSSRLSYELVHKACMLGVNLVAAVGAPTSMALALAQKQNITTFGFLKSGQFNLYTNPQHFVEADDARAHTQ